VGASVPGTFAAAEISAEGVEPLLLISAYGLLENGSSHPSLHRLLSDIEPLIHSAKSRRMVIAGDLNSGDQPYDWSTPFHVPVWQRFELLGFRNLLAQFASGPLLNCSCTKGIACRHVRTQKFRANSSRPWQADYVLVTTALEARFCRALNESPDEGWVSDHCPVVAELNV
jgi:endonuclease/exonuclease/phosphatase family metal-dependent hydrolase